MATARQRERLWSAFVVGRKQRRMVDPEALPAPRRRTLQEVDPSYADLLAADAGVCTLSSLAADVEGPRAFEEQAGALLGQVARAVGLARRRKVDIAATVQAAKSAAAARLASLVCEARASAPDWNAVRARAARAAGRGAGGGCLPRQSPGCDCAATNRAPCRHDDLRLMLRSCPRLPLPFLHAQAVIMRDDTRAARRSASRCLVAAADVLETCAEELRKSAATIGALTPGWVCYPVLRPAALRCTSGGHAWATAPSMLGGMVLALTLGRGQRRRGLYHARESKPKPGRASRARRGQAWWSCCRPRQRAWRG